MTSLVPFAIQQTLSQKQMALPPAFGVVSAKVQPSRRRDKEQHNTSSQPKYNTRRHCRQSNCKIVEKVAREIMTNDKPLPHLDIVSVVPNYDEDDGDDGSTRTTVISPFSNEEYEAVTVDTRTFVTIIDDAEREWSFVDPSTDLNWFETELKRMISNTNRIATRSFIAKDDDLFLGYLKETMDAVNTFELARYSLVVVDSNRHIVGMAIGHQYDTKQDDESKILLSLLRVSKNWRKAKLGTAILQAWLTKITQQGGEHLKEICLECPLDLVPFYSSFGFEPSPYLGGRPTNTTSTPENPEEKQILDYHGMALKRKGSRWLIRKSSCRSGVPRELLSIDNAPSTLATMSRKWSK